LGCFVAAIALAVVAGAEHLARRSLQRQYRQALASQQQLEQRFGEVLRSHDTLQERLTGEQRRSQELADALLSARGQLEQATARLIEESRSVKELQVRLAAMQRQMDQLQGELSVTLQQTPRAAPAKPSGTVSLERIIVSNVQATGLRGRILSVHPEWNFVVIDLGWSAVRIGDTLSIVRNGQVLAKARVERVQEGVCAATILPQGQIADVRINDAVQAL
jgi:hypothetical protein